jgi:hypothetical protein
VVGDAVGDAVGEGLAPSPPPPVWSQAPKVAAKPSTKTKLSIFLFIHSSFMDCYWRNRLLFNHNIVFFAWNSCPYKGGFLDFEVHFAQSARSDVSVSSESRRFPRASLFVSCLRYWRFIAAFADLLLFARQRICLGFWIFLKIQNKHINYSMSGNFCLYYF